MSITPQSTSTASEGMPGMSADAMPQLTEYLGEATRFITEWMAEYGPSTPHPAQNVDPAQFKATFDELTSRLSINYPFFHPRYVGQMLKPPHPAAVVGYLTTMLINPNNHDLDAGAATTRMEVEAVDAIARMFGCSGDEHRMCHLGHLTTSGTVANLEALFVARETHPRKAIAHSADAHYILETRLGHGLSSEYELHS